MPTPTPPRRPSRLARAKRKAAVVTSAALLAAGGTAITVGAPSPSEAPSDAPNVAAAHVATTPVVSATPDSAPAVPITPVSDVRAEDGTPIAGGEASYYGRELAGNPTASGEPFNPAELTAAHRTLPLGTRVRVTHAESGESVVVRVNDRGPFHDDRVIDVSRAAADSIGLTQSGTAEVELERLPKGGARG